MPTIKHFSENGLVGVLKPCCTTAADHIKALTAQHPIKPTSLRCPSAWQPNPGRRSTYRCGDSVQTTGATSYFDRPQVAGDAASAFQWNVVPVVHMRCKMTASLRATAIVAFLVPMR